MKILAALLTTLFSLNTWAAGGIHCEINDQNINFELSATVSHGIPSGPFNTKGKITFKSKKVSHMNQSDFSDVLQAWLEDGVINLVVYKEPNNTEGHSTINLKIKTKSIGGDEDYVYRGKYNLDVYYSTEDSYNVSGRVTCEFLS